MYLGWIRLLNFSLHSSQPFACLFIKGLRLKFVSQSRLCLTGLNPTLRMDYTAIEGILIWRIAGLFELGPVCWLSFWRWKRSIVQRDYSRYPKPIFDHNLHLRPQKYTAEFWNNFLCNLFWTIDPSNLRVSQRTDNNVYSVYSVFCHMSVNSQQQQQQQQQQSYLLYYIFIFHGHLV